MVTIQDSPFLSSGTKDLRNRLEDLLAIVEQGCLNKGETQTVLVG